MDERKKLKLISILEIMNTPIKKQRFTGYTLGTPTLILHRKQAILCGFFTIFVK